MTVLMRSLADNILVGLPQNLTILHVAQLQVFDEEMTVLKEVVSADRETMQVVREAASKLQYNWLLKKSRTWSRRRSIQCFKM